MTSMNLQIMNVNKQKNNEYQMKALIEMNQMVCRYVLLRLQNSEGKQSRCNDFLGDHSPNMGKPSGHMAKQKALTFSCSDCQSKPFKCAS